MTPITTSSRLITVAKTGRRIERSERTTLLRCRLGGGCRRGCDARAVSQLDRALAHDGVARRKTGGDLDLAATSRSQRDLDALGRLVLRHAVHESLGADLDHCDLRHDDRSPRSLV